MKKKNLKGILSTTNRGFGFVSVEGYEDDFFIPPGELGTGFHGDTVEISISKEKGGGRQEASVKKVLGRARTHFVGYIQKEGSHHFLIPDSQKMYTKFLILDSEIKPKEGYKAQVEFKEWTKNQDYPSAVITDIIGKQGEHETEMNAIMLDKGIEYNFPPEIEKEAQKVAKDPITSDIHLRKDMRDILTVTIDPADAKDFDDALSFQQLSDGNYEIGIHIADVSHYVKEGSKLDHEARERAFSVYLVDRTIPMLPEVLSNDVCSLNPNVDRRAFSGVFKLSSKGEVLDRWFGKTLIHSDRRFSYEEAQDLIATTKHLAVQPLSVGEALTTMNSIAKKLRKARFDNGAVDFADDEVKFVLDDDGKPLKVIKKERLDTHKMIEEYMLLCNREVAEFVKELGKKNHTENTLLYRIHDLPDRDRLEELGLFLRALGFDFDPSEHKKIDGRILNTLLEQAKDTPQEGLINTQLIRSMAKALYSTKDKGHFGLAFKHYVHFTSPIRRYPDLIVHRLLNKYLQGKILPKSEINTYVHIADSSSERELEVVEAERESIKYKQVEYMSEHVGEEFEGTITGLSEGGMFIEEKETKAQGFVKLASLKDDYYDFLPKKFAVVGQKTKNTYTLGDTVTFTIANADLEKKQLDFELVV